MERKSVDSRGEAHFWLSYWMRTRRLKRLCYTSIQALLYRHLHALWLLRAAPPVVNTQPVVSAAACVVLGAFDGALSERISGDTKNPRFRRTGDYLCARGDLNPHPLIRGLAPQASASAYSATRAGDFRTFSFRCRSKQHVILYGLSEYSANRMGMFCVTTFEVGWFAMPPVIFSHRE